MNQKIPKSKGRYIASIIFATFLIFLVNIFQQAYSQAQKRNEIKKEESFNRPKPTRPIKPEIPDVNRYQEDKVFLEYADSLFKIKTRDTVERQILKGDVVFRQGGMWMYCDSAYYYPEENSLDAFSNVRMEQGDTLFVYADKLFYNGDARMAYLKNGPSRDKVTLINKDVTLTSDSLDYDLGIDLGWYSRWGKIDDKVNTLTSLYGEYSPTTKRAEFYNNVVLVNNRDGFTMLTDTLHYNTETHIANIDSRTEIQSENDTIITNLATYYTDTGDADLMSRSIIIHRDSTGNVITLEGDSIIYDNSTRISRVYMFNDMYKRSYPMVLTDTAQKMTLIGGFGIYNDSTKEAFATIYPLLMEYSQGDTLFLRADTIKTYIITEMVAVKKKRKTKSGFPEYNGIPIVKADSSGIWIDTAYFSVTIPLIDAPIYILNQNLPPKAVKKDDPTIADTPYEIIPDDTIEIGKNELDIVLPNDSTNIEKLSLVSEEIVENDLNNITGINFTNADDDLFQAEDIVSLNEIATTEKEDEDSKNNIDLDGEEPLFDSIPKEFHIAVAYYRGRFFKQDLQGVADSIVFVERDSMLFLYRKPIVWSGERQVTGNRIDVHFNDSTADWAYLPESGLISEYIDEDFYNQISGKEITAYFEGRGLKRMYVSGNVETIFLPQESDSTYNRLVQAESSYLDLYLKDNKMDVLKMWPEVSGRVTPIFMVKNNQKYLQKFRWWSVLRPEREWYGDRLRWADNLGEVPDELEQYFLAPSDFGTPKSYSATRVKSQSSMDYMKDLNNPSEMIDSITTSPGNLIHKLKSNNKELTDSLGEDSSFSIQQVEKPLNDSQLEEEIKETEREEETPQNSDLIKDPVKEEEFPKTEELENENNAKI